MRILRRLLERLTGYPNDDELARHYRYAWRVTGRRPTNVKRLLTGDVSAVYRRGSYNVWCTLRRDGTCYVMSFDTEAFTDYDGYHRRRWRVNRVLGFLPEKPTLNECLTYCARAVGLSR